MSQHARPSASSFLAVVAAALLAAAPRADARIVDVEGLTIEDVGDGLAAGEFTAEDLVESFLARIRLYEPTYNAYIALVPGVIARARALDAEYRESGPRSPLHGVPIALKDAVDMAGLPTTAGFSGWSENAGGVDLIPELDAPVTARLEAAGAIIIGKTNLPAFAADGTRANSSFAGPTFNAYDVGLAPGASSSGSATATAASLAVAAIAEETGGSIQNPAGAQSLVGIKPTFGLVPNVGVVPLAGSTRDVIGPLGKTVRDAAMMLDVLAGPSPEDPKTAAAEGQIPAGGYTSGLDVTALQGKRLGLFGPGFKPVELTPETQALYDLAVEAIVGEGATVVPDPFAGTGFVDLSPPGGFDARGLESLPYDMQQYLHRLGPSAAIRDIDEAGLFAPDGFFGPFVGILPGLAEGAAHPDLPPDLASFFADRAAMVAALEEVMEANDLDGFFFPQMFAPLPAVDGDGTYANTTVSEINVMGTPGVTVSGGYYADGSPFSLIFLGEPFAEARLLAYAYDFEQATELRVEPRLVRKPQKRIYGATSSRGSLLPSVAE